MEYDLDPRVSDYLISPDTWLANLEKFELENRKFFLKHMALLLIHRFTFMEPFKARFKRRSIHAPNLTDELSTAEERRLNQFGSAD